MSRTKGPYRKAYYEHEDGSKTTYIKEESTGLLLAEICKGTSNDEGNADLLAAAPDLLEALEGLLAQAISMYASGSRSIFAIVKAEEAIAKARGQDGQ